MTQMPPPPSMPYQPGMQQPMKQPAQTNVAAIISLICGIIGCLVITPVVAIVAGIIGLVQAKTLKTGKGMSIAGIVLGVFWIVVPVAIFSVLGYGVSHGGGALLNAGLKIAAKPALQQELNALADGDTVVAGKFLPNATSEQIDSLAAELKPLGHVKTIDFTAWNSDFTSQQGKGIYTFTADVKFDNGEKTVDGEATTGQGTQNGIALEKIDIK